MAVNWLNQAERKTVAEEIGGPENITRKKDEQKKFDVYRGRQDKYVIEKLMSEFKQDFVDRMRKVLSINPCSRIVDEMASIYRTAPARTFSNSSEAEQELLENMYQYASADSQMRRANVFYKLHSQAALMVIPRNGHICFRPLTPKDYDVIPKDDDPELAQSYILNTWNMDANGSYGYATGGGDGRNQTIADENDRKAKQRLIVWDEEIHLTMNGFGDVIGDIIENPIGKLPFVDIACEKDFQFFVKRGSGPTEFTIDLLAQLCDLASISRMQGYSQGVISHTDEPKPMVVGPDRIIWLKKDPNVPNSDPTFEFVSPSPDLAGSLEIIDAQMKMFLSSQGLDVSVVSGKGEKKSFASGIDHLLSNLDKFQASQEDMSLFQWVEQEAFDIARLWTNELAQVTDGPLALLEDVRGRISPEVSLNVKFHQPTSVRTQTETEDSVIKLMESGLMSRKQAVMRLYEVDDDKAEEMIKEIDETDSDTNEVTESNEEGN